MTFYTELADMVVDLLTPDEAGGLGAAAGSVTLSRKVVTPAANSWEAPTIATTTETLLGQVFGVSSEFVGLPANEPDNGVVLSSDMSVICAIPANGYATGDLVSVNGRPVSVIITRTIPAAGTPVALKLVVRG